MQTTNLTFDQLPNKVQVLAEQVQRLVELFEGKPETGITNEDLMTRKEGCDLLQVSDPTFWKWAKQGKIKTYKIGGRVYVKRSELMDVINTGITKK